jgi:hypothetical protein
MHIGEKIKSRAKDLRLGPTELAKIIKTSKQNVYGIYRRDSIDSELLFELSKALDTDFFTIYSKMLSAGKGIEEEISDDTNTLGTDLVSVKKELSSLREKYALLRALYESKTGERLPEF